MIQLAAKTLREGFRPAAGRIAAIFLAMLMVAACADGPRENLPAVASSPAATSSESTVPLPPDADIDYRLGSGDKLRVIVFGEPNLSGEFDVSGSGKVALPLVGQVEAQGLTVSQFEAAMIAKLMDGYLNNPRVSVEVMNYRPFYIYGEVGNPGQYPYTNGMTVLNAIAVAGGYTYRANTNQIYITRGEGAEQAYPASQAVKVLPGDVVRVPERFF
ncbi:MAG: polysaccharide export protein [Parvibaculum sp.]|nr:polysaccharide export protein [Parvibaculum sp.]